MALAGGGGGGHVRGRRRPRKRPLSEINVTPLVDVMLVLLIIFMVSAPLLTTGVEVELPKTEARAVETDQEPVVVSIDRDGGIFLRGEGHGRPAALPLLPGLSMITALDPNDTASPRTAARISGSMLGTGAIPSSKVLR